MNSNVKFQEQIQNIKAQLKTMHVETEASAREHDQWVAQQQHIILQAPSTKLITASEANRLHQEAMELVDQAVLARRNGDAEAAMQLVKAAFLKEQAAADLIAPNLDLEPSRSVLHRSAATLAVECAELRAAEKLIGQALAGNPPAAIAEELRDLLLTEIYPQRQLLSA